ncbi:hypothetical protein MKX01_009470, partial [Papaver californicum]
MVVGYTIEEDVFIVTSWCNVILPPSTTQNQLSGLELCVCVRENLEAGTYENPNQRNVDAIKKIVGDIRKKVNFFVMILLPIYRNPPSGFTEREIVSSF